MGFFDYENMFDNDKAITTTTACTNLIDVGKNRGAGEPIRVLAQVTTAFTAAAPLTDTLTFSLQSCTSAGFTTPVTVATGAAYLQAALTLGKKVLDVALPSVHGRYLRLYITKSGSAFTAGKYTGGLILDDQTNYYTLAADTDTGVR
jgi:hypothetical protein